MRYLTGEQVIQIHKLLIAQSGGSSGLRDQGALESTLAQPRMTFDGIDLYATLLEKVAALGFSLIQNHPFVDGNKRIGHAAMEIMLYLNRYEITANVDEQEQLILTVASGQLSRENLTAWLEKNIAPLPSGKKI